MTRDCVLWTHSALIIGSLVFALFFARIARATQYLCANGYAEIYGDTQDDGALICEAAERTVWFAKSINLKVTEIVEIEIIDTDNPCSPEAVGCFDWDRKKVLLLENEQYENRINLAEFGELSAYEAYVGFAAHEIMHAIASENFSILQPTIATQEYIACIAQVSVLAETERAKLLAAVDGDGFGKASEITLFAYQVGPTRFVVESYRHFLKPENGARFAKALLSGAKILKDHYPYGY